MNKVLKIEDHFFAEDYCKKIIHDAENFQQSVSKVGLKEGGVGIRTESRNSISFQLPQDWYDDFNAKIQAYIPIVEKTFDFKVNQAMPQKIRFLGYKKGHYFKPHRDAYEDERYPGTENFKVTGVIYLNEYEVEGPSPGNFMGGEFLVYGLNPESETLATPVLPETGQLVLFNSSLIHEVLPITGGTRYCITTWFC